MGKSLMDIAVDKLYQALGGENLTGKLGEAFTAKELRYVQLFGRKGKILRNVYVPKDNGETSEIDLLYITKKGILVFESKNYSGWIFGDEKSQKWTMMLPNKEKHSFYNPIKQNQTHIKWLRSYIGEEIPLFSIIVFSERCELKKVTITSPEIKVIKRDYTYAAVRDIWNKNEDQLSGEEVEQLYRNLQQLTKVSKEIKDAHIQNIKDKYISAEKESDDMKEIITKTEERKVELENKEVETVESQNLVPDKVCPRCGNKLVLRIAKKGANAGKQFWGCSGFPKCRYIE